MAAASRLAARASPGEAGESDEAKLKRLLRRLSGARELGLTLGGDEDDELSLQARSDASRGARADAKSRAGLRLTLGRGPTLRRSRKQKSVARSPCEAEALALSDAASIAAWTRGLRRDASTAADFAASVYEDNAAATRLASNGASTSDRGRRAHARGGCVGRLVESGQIKAARSPAERATADALAKPLGASQLSRLRGRLLGYEAPEKGRVMGGGERVGERARLRRSDESGRRPSA